MSVARTRAIVLRRTDYGEADRILQLLTPTGKMSVIARAVRREKSKLAGGIELFAVSDVVVNSGKGDLGILTSARLVQFYRHILEDYDRLQFGYEAIRQVAKASETVDEPEWYDVLLEVLMALDAESIELPLIQTWYYLHHAALLGREINLQYDVDGSKLESEKSYIYDISEDGLRAVPHGEVNADHIKLLRILMTKPIQAVAQIGGVDTVLPDIWLIARQHAAV